MMCYVWHVCLTKYSQILEILCDMTNVATIVAGCRDKSSQVACRTLWISTTLVALAY